MNFCALFIGLHGAIWHISRIGPRMVETGLVDTIRQMTYRPADRAFRMVEILTFDRLRAVNDGGTQRADFYVLAIIDAGVGVVTIDFVRYALSGRSLVWIAPGAVHAWHDIAGLVGHIVLFVPTAPVNPIRAGVASADVAATWTPGSHQWPLVEAARNHLLLEFTSGAGDLAQPELLRILLSALIARIDPPRVTAAQANSTFEIFRSSVEKHFRRHRDVGYYARTLGFAPRTLTRATQVATGRTAKAYIVDRVILEAKRLLAHDRFTGVRCAAELGFPDASNFSLFFRNATGVRPGAWQAAAT
jgi:AraC-like DNA-binding protein